MTAATLRSSSRCPGMMIVILALLVSAQAAAPTNASPPASYDVGTVLGPWPVEQLLYPYPATGVGGDQMVWPGTATPRDFRRFAYAATRRSVVHQSLRYVKVLADSMFEVMRYGARSVSDIVETLHGHVGDALDTLHVAIVGDNGPRDRFVMTPAGSASPRTDQADVIPLFADIVFPIESIVTTTRQTARVTKRHSMTHVEMFVQLTAVSFLAMVLLVPTGCSLAAGALYARDGPRSLAC